MKAIDLISDKTIISNDANEYELMATEVKLNRTFICPDTALQNRYDCCLIY